EPVIGSICTPSDNEGQDDQAQHQQHACEPHRRYHHGCCTHMPSSTATLHRGGAECQVLTTGQVLTMGQVPTMGEVPTTGQVPTMGKYPHGRELTQVHPKHPSDRFRAPLGVHLGQFEIGRAS